MPDGNGRKQVLILQGSASSRSSNLLLAQWIARSAEKEFDSVLFDGLKTLPHFDPEQSLSDPPESVIAFRAAIERSDGIVVCTPEYVFSLPSGLKNALEWCISTTVFQDKPCGLVTASADGERGHEQLQLVLRTAMARFTADTSLLIRGIKGKFDGNGNLVDPETRIRLDGFLGSFVRLLEDR